MLRHMGAREARQKFSEMLGRVRYGGETVILESSGKPVAALIPLDLYRRLMEQRNARFAVIAEIQSQMPAYPADEVEADIAEAIEAVRTADGASRP